MASLVTTEYVDAAFNDLIVTKTKQLSDVMDNLKDILIGDDSEKREQGVEIVVNLILKLPTDYLTSEQVGLLLDFLMGRIESSALIGGTVVEGIRHLVTKYNLPNGCAQPIIQILFNDGNVQGWPQEQRSHFYDILEVMLIKFDHELQPLGSDIVLTFVRTMGGERDPRCLIKAFNLFRHVATKFPMGVLVEDMFEVVACYYPVEFKPTPGKDSITREMLAAGCENAFLSHTAFAPFTYMMIEEKLTDEETSHEHKFQICDFLSKATTVYNPSSLLPHVESILGGIRAVGLHPKEKDSMNSHVRGAMQSVVRTVRIAAPEKMGALAKNLLDNVEPFVLQAEMGLSDRALMLLEIVAREKNEDVVDRAISFTIMLVQACDPGFVRRAISSAFDWISSVVKGDTVNSASNRSDIAKEGLQYLAHWVQLAKEMEYDLLLDRYSPSIFASIDVARESVPADAMRCMYKCAKTYLHVIPPNSDINERFESLVRNGLKSVETDEERAELLSFITEFSQCKWDQLWTILEENLDKDLPKMFAVMCHCVVEWDSWEKCKENIMAKINLKELCFQMPYFVEMSGRVNEKVAVDAIRTLVNWTAFKVDLKAIKETSQYDSLATTFQDLGLLLNESQHTDICYFIKQHFDERRRDVFFVCLLLLAQNTAEIFMEQGFSSKETSSKEQLFIQFVAANREMSWLKIPTESPERNAIGSKLFGKLMKALMIKGNPLGMVYLREFFDMVGKSERSPQDITDTLTDLFEFDSPNTDPIKLKLNTSALWRQRIFCQFVPLYISTLSELKDDPLLRGALLRPLSSILSFARTIESGVEYHLEQFLPIFIDSLASPNGMDVSPVLSALSPLLAVFRISEMQRRDIDRLTDALRIIIDGGSVNMMSLLDALSSLETLARRSKPEYVLPHCNKVLLAVSKQTGHKKRVVRQKAASVCNTWELLITK